jgi:hypothetical protein
MAAPAPRDAKRACPAALEARVSTTELPGLGRPGRVYSVLAGKGEERFLGTLSALYLQVHGRLALIAGHSSEPGFKDGEGDEARFNGISGLALERGGSVLVSDSENHSVRRVSPHGQVTTVAGNGKAGFADGVGDAVRFHYPNGIEVDGQGLIYVADTANHCIRKVQPADGTVSTLCGKAKEPGRANGPAAEARFGFPAGLALDMNEDLIVTDLALCNVRKVALPGGRVTTVAQSLERGDAGTGYADGTATAARLNWPIDVAVDGSNAILVADQENHRVRKISGEGGVVTTVAGHAEAGKVDGTGPNARFMEPGRCQSEGAETARVKRKKCNFIFCEHDRRKDQCKDCKGTTVTKLPPTSKRQVDGIPGTERLSKRHKKEAAVRASNDPQMRVRVCVCVVCVVAWIRFVTRTHTHTHTHTQMHTHTHKCTHIHGMLTRFPRTRPQPSVGPAAARGARLMEACVSGLQALEDAQLFRRKGLPAAALGVKELQIKQEEGKRQPGDFARVLGPIAATMPLRNASHASRPVVKVEQPVG